MTDKRKTQKRAYRRYTDSILDKVFAGEDGKVIRPRYPRLFLMQELQKRGVMKSFRQFIRGRAI